ncbi:unnamed protein product, partial [Ectocarpus sp. 8 AP-2014]
KPRLKSAVKRDSVQHQTPNLKARRQAKPQAVLFVGSLTKHAGKTLQCVYVDFHQTAVRVCHPKSNAQWYLIGAVDSASYSSGSNSSDLTTCQYCASSSWWGSSIKGLSR